MSALRDYLLMAAIVTCVTITAALLTALLFCFREEIPLIHLTVTC